MKKILLTLSIIVCFGISQDLHAQIPNALQKKRAEMLQNAADSKEAEEAAKLEEQKKKEAEEASRLAEQKKRAEQEAARLEEEKRQKQQNDQHPPNQPPKDEREQAPTLGNQPAQPPVKTPSDQERIGTDADAEKAKKEAEAKAKAEAEAKARQEAEAKAKEEEKKKKATPYERPRKRVRTPISDPKTTLPKEGIKDKIEPKTLPNIPAVMIPATTPQEEEPKEGKIMEIKQGILLPGNIAVGKLKEYKLKITITDYEVESVQGKNDSDIAAQSLMNVFNEYKIAGNIKKPHKMEKKVGNKTQNDQKLVDNYESVAYPSKANQRVTMKSLVGNSFIYHITEEDLKKESYLDLKIDLTIFDPVDRNVITRAVTAPVISILNMLELRDKSADLVKINYMNRIKINEVIKTLSGERKFNPSTRYPHDNYYPSSMKFDVFDGTSLPLKKVDYIQDKLVLEGPATVRNEGAKVRNKFFVWFRFELID